MIPPVPHDPSNQADGYAGDAVSTRQLSALLVTITANLLEAIRQFRGDGVELSLDERRHAAKWAWIALSLMSQEQARTVQEAQAASFDAILQGVAAEQREVDADHSASYALHQTTDALVQRLRGYDVPQALHHAMTAVLGIATHTVTK